MDVMDEEIVQNVLQELSQDSPEEDEGTLDESGSTISVGVESLGAAGRNWPRYLGIGYIFFRNCVLNCLLLHSFNSVFLLFCFFLSCTLKLVYVCN